MKIERTGLDVINDMTIARSLEEKGRAYLDPRIFFIPGKLAPCRGTGAGTREELAERLDIQLRRLSRAETALDIIQGKLLFEIKKKGSEELGYTRTLNYAREELGISERLAQELLRMERLLLKFPLFSAAYEEGSLTRSKVRLLLRYLEPEDEGQWLKHAKGWSVRMLEDCLRFYRQRLSELRASPAVDSSSLPHLPGEAGGGVEEAKISGAGFQPAFSLETAQAAPGDVAPVNTPLDPSIAQEVSQVPETAVGGKTSQKKAREWAAGQALLKSQEPETKSALDDDEEETVGEWISIPASGRLHEKWRRFIEISRRMEGKDLPPWVAVEYACADFLAGAPLSAIAGACPVLRHGESGEACGSLAAESNDPDSGSKGAGADYRRDNSAWRETLAIWRKRRLEAAEEEERALQISFNGWDFLSWEKPEIELPQEWKSFPQDVREMHEMLKEMCSFKAGLHYALICLLGTFKSNCLFFDLQFRSFEHYAIERLGMSRATAYRYAAISKGLVRFPALVSAIAEGVLCLEKARLCGKLSLYSGDDLWIPYAEMVPTVRLRRVVEILEDMKSEFDHSFRHYYHILPFLLLRCEEQGDHELSSIRSLLAKREALWMMGRSHELDERDDELLVSVCAPVHDGPPLTPPTPASPTSSLLPEPPPENGARENDIAAQEVLAKGVVDKPERVWPIRFYLPEDLIGVWERTICTVRRLHGESLSFSECLEILVESFLADHENEDEKKEHKIIERDGWRCTVPGCGSRWNLHVHHIKFRSQGGADEPSNETTVCLSCHQRAIHKGYIRVSGQAPGNLVWEMGVSPMYPQIARYVNGLRVAA